MEPFYPPQVCIKLGHPRVCTAGSLKCVTQLGHSSVSHSAPQFKGKILSTGNLPLVLRSPKQQQQAAALSKPWALLLALTPLARQSSQSHSPCWGTWCHGHHGYKIVLSVFGIDKTLLEQLLAHSPGAQRRRLCQLS